VIVNQTELDALDVAVKSLRDTINSPKARHDEIYRSLHRPPKEGDPPEVFYGSDDEKESLWIRLCACLDVIDDTTWAMRAYQEDIANEELAITGMNYLRLYGVMQAIYAQQDALKHIGTAIGAPLEFKGKYRRLGEIRFLRNVAIGHPSRNKYTEEVLRDGKLAKRNIVSHGFLIRSNLWKDSFELSNAARSGANIRRHFLPEIIRDQVVLSKEIVDVFINKLIKEFPG